MSFRHSKIDKKAIMKVMDKKIAEKQALTKQRREEQLQKYMAEIAKDKTYPKKWLHNKKVI